MAKRFGGSCAKRHRMRCSVCHRKARSDPSRPSGRFTLKRRPDQYVRAPRCPSCGSTRVYSCEASRRREQLRQDTCYCAAYPFPHRAGTLRMCERHPRIAEYPTADEIDHYEAILLTPRSRY